jgi:hypothetical protein
MGFYRYGFSKQDHQENAVTPASSVHVFVGQQACREPAHDKSMA